MRQRSGNQTRRQRGAIRAFIACCMLLITPAAAQAACTPSQRADARAITQHVAQLRATGHAGAADAAAIAARGRKRCEDLRLVRAIVRATHRAGMPRVGQRRRVLDIDLIGTTDAQKVVWRLDTVRLATRIKTTRSSRVATRLRARLTAASFGHSHTIWSYDPTRVRFDADRQSAVAATLAASTRMVDRRLAGRGVRAFSASKRLATPARAGLVQQLRIGNRLARAATRSGSKAAVTTARRVGLRAFVRVRAAQRRSWSRIDGKWSTAGQHRKLVQQAALLVRRVPHASTQRVVTKLQQSLTSAPGVDFRQLPEEAFYPWPRDEAFDTITLGLDVDKPVRISLTIFAPDADTVVRTIEQTVVPGSVTFTWDGDAASGDIVGAGSYRYRIDAADPLGNDVRVPGLRQFIVARDTTKPTIISASARHVRTASARRIIASWEVTEQHSPHVRTWLILRKGEQRTTIRLHERVQRATVRRNVNLEHGTWIGTMVFIDGSGNRISRRIGQVVVR